MHPPRVLPRASIVTIDAHDTHHDDADRYTEGEFERALDRITTKRTYQKEVGVPCLTFNHWVQVSMGKRIALYKLGPELGAGHYAKVIETISKVYLVLELAGGGNLYDYVIKKRQLADEEAAPLFAQIVSAVTHMHNAHIVHRDIKAENVFFVSTTCVKLGDFGFSAEIEPGAHLRTYCCTPSYAAPELFCDKEYRGEYVDIWALGVLLYFMLAGQTPFRSDTVSKLKKLILADNLSIPDTAIKPCARHLIQAILVQLPTSRLSMRGISVSGVVPVWIVAKHSLPPLAPNPIPISLQRHQWLKHVIVR
ncbi:unnamed protein product, partial [Sphagnum balticum]